MSPPRGCDARTGLCSAQLPIPPHTRGPRQQACAELAKVTPERPFRGISLGGLRKGPRCRQPRGDARGPAAVPRRAAQRGGSRTQKRHRNRARPPARRAPGAGSRSRSSPASQAAEAAGLSSTSGLGSAAPRPLLRLEVDRGGGERNARCPHRPLPLPAPRPLHTRKPPAYPVRRCHSNSPNRKVSGVPFRAALEPGTLRAQGPDGRFLISPWQAEAKKLIIFLPGEAAC